MESELKKSLTFDKMPFLISMIAMGVSLIVWATTASVKADNAASRLDKLENYSQRAMEDDQKFEREVIERLARIEQALKQ